MKIHIENYQSIADVVFNTKGFTVITGKTNIGKSAVIRAVRSALRNNKGNAYIRNGEDTCTVQLQDGKTVDILWQKGQGNQYKINGTDYKNIGFDIPADMSVLGFRALTVGDRELYPQVSDQFSPLFMVNETGSVCAEVLFDVSRVNVLNSAQKMIERDHKAAKSEQKLRREDLKGIEQKLDGLVEVQRLRDSVVALQRQDTALTKSKKVIQQDADLYDRFKVIGTSVKKLLPIGTVKILSLDCDDTIQLLNWLARKDSVFRRASSRSLQLNGVSEISLSESQTRISDLIKEYRSISTAQQQCGRYHAVIHDLNVITDLHVPMTPEIGDHSVLQNLLHTVMQRNNMVKQLQAEVGKVDAELMALTQEVQNIQQTIKVCPLCGKDIDNDSIPHQD